MSKPITHVADMPVLTLIVWAKQNKVPYSTAQLWAATGKIPTHVYRKARSAICLVRSDTPKPTGGTQFEGGKLKPLPFVTLTEWANESGVDRSVIDSRIRRGALPEDKFYLCGNVWLIASDYVMPPLTFGQRVSPEERLRRKEVQSRLPTKKRHSSQKVKEAAGPEVKAAPAIRVRPAQARAATI